MSPTISSFLFLPCFMQSFLEPVKTSPVDAQADASAPSPQHDIDGEKGNVHAPVGNGRADGDAYTSHLAGGDGSPQKADQRRSANQNKRKADSPNGPSLDSPSSGANIPVHQGSSGPPASLPPRPSAATVASSLGGTLDASRSDRPWEKAGLGRQRRSSPPSALDSPSSAGPSTVGPPQDAGEYRSAKKPRADDRPRGAMGSTPVFTTIRGAATALDSGDVSGKGKATEGSASTSTPSLLSRMMNGGTASPSARSHERDGGRRSGRGGGSGEKSKEWEGEGRNPGAVPAVPAKRRSDASAIAPSSTARPVQTSVTFSSGRAHQPQSSVDPDKDPVGGYSIRGAAKAKAAGRTSPTSGEGAGSLLQRMQPQREGSGHSSDGGRRKKRMKHS